MREKDVWPVMREARPKGVTAHRIETGRTTLGVADVLWFTNSTPQVGWCEVKTARLDGGRLFMREEMKIEQADFLVTAARGGCLSHVLITWLDSIDHWHWALVSGLQAHALVGLGSLPLAVENWSAVDYAGSRPTGRDAMRHVWRCMTGHQDHVCRGPDGRHHGQPT